MNLRKALDKARKEREAQGGIESAPAIEQSEKILDRSEPKWQSPVYAESKTVAIDLKTAVKNHCVALSPEFVEVDYYKVLRTQLRHIGKKKAWNTIMVTSVSPGEGKTVTAINLAVTYAREYSQTVLLVDADLRMQSIHRYLGYRSPLGLLDYLEEQACPSTISSPGRALRNLRSFPVAGRSRLALNSWGHPGCRIWSAI